MQDTSMTDSLVSLIMGVLAVMDRVLDGVVNLSAAEPLTNMGSGNAGALAEIAVAVADFMAKLVHQIVIATQYDGFVG